MSDSGSDMGNSSVSLMTRLLEALMKLIGKVYDSVNEKLSAEYRLKKAELNQINEKLAEKKFAEKIDGKVGYVNQRDLIKAGVPLSEVGITIDDKGFKELAARCKREGITITGIEDMRQRELTGTKSFIVQCKQSDLDRFKSLWSLIFEENRIKKIQQNIDEIEEKTKGYIEELEELKAKSEPTQEELDRMKELSDEIESNNKSVAELNKQIEEIRYGHSEQLNSEQALSVVEKAVNGETQHGVSFDEAVNRWTGGSINKDTTCYVVDMKNPDKYIECHASMDRYNNEDYIKTDYKVYNGSKMVLETNDARFDGRPKDYWIRQREDMKAAGGFSDLVIKFYSVKEMEAFRQNYKTQNETELNMLDAGKEGRDYEKIIDSLKEKLDECGATYKDGAVVNKENGKAITLTENMSEVDRAYAAEAVIAGQQIKNYEEIKKIEGELSLARTDVITTTEGTPEHLDAQAKFNEVDKRYKTALETERQLIEERKNINAVQAEHDVKDALEEEKADNRREDRVAEVGDRNGKMAEYKGEISEKSHNLKDGAKKNDFKDIEVAKPKLVPTPERLSDR